MNIEIWQNKNGKHNCAFALHNLLNEVGWAVKVKVKKKFLKKSIL